MVGGNLILGKWIAYYLTIIVSSNYNVFQWNGVNNAAMKLIITSYLFNDKRFLLFNQTIAKLNQIFGHTTHYAENSKNHHTTKT